MKKSLFFAAAASALMLTACSSENDVVQNTTNQNTATVQQQAVGFDVYTQQATNVTRAGLEGTMTTSHMQRSEYEGGGFGVYAYQVQDNIAAAGYDGNALKYEDWMTRAVPAHTPNFMVNEKLLWNSTNQGWYYNPLKYWPNETDNDSQNTQATMLGDGTNNHIDRLTFFAYAPYVSTGDNTAPGIMRLTDERGYINKSSNSTVVDNHLESKIFEPSIQYRAAIDDPNKAVDLLWGVAPAGGINYTAVNGKTVTVKEGMPLIDMTKPDINTSMKFLFQHALARIGVTAVAAVDQVGAGGKLDPNTKITIEKITLTGYFGETGILNLDNVKENVANWRTIGGVDLTGKTSATTVAATTLPQTTLTLVADHSDDATEANHKLGTIARHLQFVGTPAAQSAPSNTPVAQEKRVGVTTVRQNVIMPALIDNDPGAGHNRPWYSTTNAITTTNELEYSENTPYYTDKDCATLAQATITLPTGTGEYLCTVNNAGIYTSSNADVNLKYPSVNNYQVVTFYKVVSASPTGAQILDTDASLKGKQAYTRTGTDPYTFTPKAVGLAPAAGDYVIVADITEATALYPSLAAPGKPYYKRDANYFMVVPINNVPNICTNLVDEAELEKLRTVTVKIEYYITTEDGKLADGRAQTKNVITKDVVFPSIANGKSYNLNLVLGLTSVKMEAEVDDWKVINVNGNLPQNTSGE